MEFFWTWKNFGTEKQTRPTTPEILISQKKSLVSKLFRLKSSGLWYNPISRPPLPQKVTTPKKIFGHVPEHFQPEEIFFFCENFLDLEKFLLKKNFFFIPELNIT